MQGERSNGTENEKAREGEQGKNSVRVEQESKGARDITDIQ